MGIKQVLAIITLVSLALVVYLFAHPGKSDRDGCHICTENCEVWGFYDGEFHCHQPHYYGERYHYKTLTKQRLICYAIENKRLLQIKRTLAGEEGGTEREVVIVEPYLFGLDTRVRGHLRAYVLPSDQEEGQEGRWETLNVTEFNVKEMRVLEGTFEGGRADAPGEIVAPIVQEVCRIK